jgi:hypothetical protein
MRQDKWSIDSDVPEGAEKAWILTARDKERIKLRKRHGETIA